PIGRELTAHATGVRQGGVHGVLDVPRIHALQDDAENIRRWSHDVIHQIDDVRAVLVEAAASRFLRRAPCGALLLDYDLPVRLAADVIGVADDPRLDQALGLPKGPQEAIVIADLIDHPLSVGQRREAATVLYGQAQRLFDEDVPAVLEGPGHRVGVGLGRRRDDDTVDILHLSIILDRPNSQVFLQHREHQTGRIRDRCDHDLRVSVQDRVMGEAHLAGADQTDSHHDWRLPDFARRSSWRFEPRFTAFRLPLANHARTRDQSPTTRVSPRRKPNRHRTRASWNAVRRSLRRMHDTAVRPTRTRRAARSPPLRPAIESHVLP